MHDTPQLPSPLPVGHFQQLTHLPNSRPERDSAQEKRLQHTTMLLDKTGSLDKSATSGSGTPDGFVSIERPSRFHRGSITRDAVRNLFSVPFCVSVDRMNRSSKHHLSLFSKETGICEKKVSPNFQFDEGLAGLFLSPRCLCESVLVIDRLVFTIWVGGGIARGGLITSFLVSGVSNCPLTMQHPMTSRGPRLMDRTIKKKKPVRIRHWHRRDRE